MLRDLIKGWLGIGALELQVGRQATSIALQSESLTAMNSTVAELRGIPRQLEVTATYWREQLDEIRSEIRVEPQSAGPAPEVQAPVTCSGCGRSGLVRAALIEEIDRADPTVSQVVGYGFACPKCKTSFYWQTGADGIGRTWKPDEKLEDEAAGQGVIQNPSPQPRRGPQVRWKPGRRE